MKSYTYVARDSSGQRKEGVRDASSSHDVLGWLREQGFTPISVNETATSGTKIRQASRSRRIKSAELAALCWQLTTMVEGGISIATALETISDDIENLQLRSVLQQVLEKIRKGETFSSSVAAFPKVFNNLACAMILAGETSGTLAEVLRRLAEHFDNRDKLAKKVRGAVAYPVFVVGFIIAIVIFIMAFIIPRFRSIFSQLGGRELPAFTRAFMGFYDVLCHNLLYIIGVIVLLVISAITLSKTSRGHLFFSKLVLALPLFGKVIRQAFVAMFCKTMATLVGAGVSMLDVFDILTGMTNNDIIKDAVVRARERIVGGLNISLSIASVGFFPNMVVKMLQVGEESGSLSTVLERTSVHYERKIDATITMMTSLLEPIMIVTVGAIVLVVVLALYLPIFTMSDM